ncbi:MAG: hypothetical protein KGO49_09195 [Gammaproteobacteria bacterium]|nr:hypothetical protein [Gammaproteobacteria bacterium]
MHVDIGAKHQIDGDKIFLIGYPKWANESPFAMLYDLTKHRESKRNIHNIDPEQIIHLLGMQLFVSITIPVWGKVWFRRSCIRKIIEMSPQQIQLSSTEIVGSYVLFTHESDEESNFSNQGFSLYGISVAQAVNLLLH